MQKLMNPTRDVLIYGFKPYLRYSVNITESIIEEINSRKIGRGLVFDVEFDSRMFTDALRRHSPKVILTAKRGPPGEHGVQEKRPRFSDHERVALRGAFWTATETSSRSSGLRLGGSAGHST